MRFVRAWLRIFVIAIGASTAHGASGQADSDGDGAGDAGDTNTDTDGDGIGDVCDGTTEVTCAVGNTFEPIILPNASVASAIDGGLLCTLCTIADEGNVIDANLANAARMTVTPSGGHAALITVTKPNGAHTGLGRIGCIVENSADSLALNILPAITITTYLGGVMAESSATGEIPDLLNATGGPPGRRIATFDTSLDFNAAEIKFASITNVNSQLDVSAACHAPR